MQDVPHLGIMHELYMVPKGGWENIYHNFRPIGMGEFYFLPSVRESLFPDMYVSRVMRMVRPSS